MRQRRRHGYESMAVSFCVRSKRIGCVSLLWQRCAHPYTKTACRCLLRSFFNYTTVCLIRARTLIRRSPIRHYSLQEIDANTIHSRDWRDEDGRTDTWNAKWNETILLRIRSGKRIKMFFFSLWIDFLFDCRERPQSSAVSLSLPLCAFLIKFFVSFDLYVFLEDTVSRHIYSQRLMHIQFHAHSFQFCARALPSLRQISVVTFVRSFSLLAANSFLHVHFSFAHAFNLNWNDDILYEGWLYILAFSNKTNADAAAATFRLYFILIFCFRLINLNDREKRICGRWLGEKRMTMVDTINWSNTYERMCAS